MSLLDFNSLEPGTELSCKKEGVVIFLRYKENKNGQNVEVKKKYAPNSPKLWLKEKALSFPAEKPLADLGDFVILSHA